MTLVEIDIPLDYIETTIPSGMEIDEYRRSRKQRRSWWRRFARTSPA